MSAAERAVFGTSSRLLSCLVTESLARALYFSLHDSDITGFAVILSDNTKSGTLYEADDVLCVVPLRHVPIFKRDTIEEQGRDIGLLDPMDMAPFIFELVQEQGDGVVSRIWVTCWDSTYRSVPA